MILSERHSHTWLPISTHPIPVPANKISLAFIILYINNVCVLVLLCISVQHSIVYVLTNASFNILLCDTAACLLNKRVRVSKPGFILEF